MENRDEILRHLEEFNSSVQESSTIPEILENYLVTVAKTGETVYPWEKLKPLLIHKADQAMRTFEGVISMDTLPTYPNVENATFEQLRLRILKTMKSFSGAPFTIQRIAELITEPRRHYKRTDKFLRGIEKNVNIVTTVDPFGIRLINDMLVINGTDSGGQATPDKNTSLFCPPAPMNSPVTSSTVVTTPETAASTGSLSGESPTTSLFKALTNTSTGASIGDSTGAHNSGSLFSLVKPDTEDQEQSTTKIFENGDSKLKQDTPRVDTTSNMSELTPDKSDAQSESNTADTSESIASVSKSEDAESTKASSCHGNSSSQGDDLRAALPSDKVTVCVDTNEDEDVDVTNSEDDKMDATQEETGVKREATALSVDSQEPPVKKQRQDDQYVATSSSQDIKRRESGGFDTMPILENNAAPSTTASQSVPETPTQLSDVSSSSVSQEVQIKDQTTSENKSKSQSVSENESESEAKPVESPVETTPAQESVSSDHVTESKEDPTNEDVKTTATTTEGEEVMGDMGTEESDDKVGESSNSDTSSSSTSNNGQDNKENTEGCEPDSAGEMNTEMAEKQEEVAEEQQNEDQEAGGEIKSEEGETSEAKEEPEPMDTD